MSAMRIRQEVLLHAAMYRAAYESRAATSTSHFILEPVREDHPPTLGVDPERFRERVLAELAHLDVPIAWAPSTWRTEEVDVFPGGSARATRLTIRVLRRDPSQATVVGEVGDVTAGDFSSRQQITAVWDGVDWRIERSRARIVW